MKAKIFLFTTLMTILLFLDSCKKDDLTPQPTVDFTMSTSKGQTGVPILFTNNSVNSTSFIWSFGDGTTSKDVSPTKSYTTPGVYQVSLVATGSGGSLIATKELTLTQPAVYFTDLDAGFIERLALDGSGNYKNFFDITGKGGVGLAYDSVHGKIYFSDFEVTGSGNIWVMDFNGTNLHTIVTDIADDPYGIGLDVAGGKIYWADNGGHISRADLAGTNVETLVSQDDIDGAQFRSNVGLDLVNHKMYFIDWENENVWQADLDGSNLTVVVPDVYGFNVFVDQVHNKIYFNDDGNDLLQMADLNGDNIVTIDDTGGRIYGIAMDPTTNKLYWSNYNTGEVYVAEIDGSARVTLKTGLNTPRALFIAK